MGTGDHAVLHPYFGLDEQSIPDSLYSEIETIIADSTEIFSGSHYARAVVLLRFS